jgi:plastocyanin
VRFIFRFLVLGCCLVAQNSQARGQGVDVSMKMTVAGGRPAGEAKRHADAPDVVVWLSPLQPLSSRPSPASHPPYRLVQRNKEFEPHLLVVPTGSSVEFPNTDPFFHNVFSLFNGKRFDLGLYESGTTRSVRFDREGVSYIFCNIHPEMGAVVLTVSTPFYAVSSTSGDVVIHGVPPGSYKLRMWSEQARLVNAGGLPNEVQVSTTDVNLGRIEMELVPNAMADHKNMFGEDYRPPPGSPY